MLSRYSRPCAEQIWTENNKYAIWFKIEAYACEAQAKLGNIPQSAVDNIWLFGDKDYDQARINRIHEIEKDVKHDIISFTTELAEIIGEDAKFIHQGLTSSDIVDTSLSFQCKQMSAIIEQDLLLLLDSLKDKAYKYKDTVCIGRSHGIHGEPITIGLKFASFYADFSRCYKRLLQAKQEISICCLSGAMGNFVHLNPYVEQYVAEKLNLTPETISTQVIPRDRHAYFMSVLAIIASCIERIAVEIRHLHRTEVNEVEELFGKKQKGSSAMPHKKNPILSENLTGLARIIKSSASVCLDNIALWHERDISHSSAERFVFPDSTVTLDFALNRLTDVVSNLVIKEDNIKNNLHKTHDIFVSQRIMLQLLQQGMSRENAYKAVQKNAMEALNKNTSIIEIIKNNQSIKLDNQFITELQSTDYYTKQVDYIFAKVFKKNK